MHTETPPATFAAPQQGRGERPLVRHNHSTVDCGPFTITIMLVTPEQAREWLETNVGNRYLRRSSREKLVHSLEQGHWRLTHQGVAFDQNNALFDGQHRLGAIADSGVPAQLMVFEGCDRGTFDVIDRSSNRKFADTCPSPQHVVAALVRLAYVWLNTGGDMSKNLGTFERTDDKDLQAVLNENPDLVFAARFAQHNRLPVGSLPKSWHALLYWQMYQLAGDDATGFWDAVRTGAGLQPGEPTYVLRERLQKISMDQAHHRYRLKPVFKAAITIKAWNAVRQGKRISYLKWQGRDPNAPAKNPEPFPKMV
jgi:hypothetical protein